LRRFFQKAALSSQPNIQKATRAAEIFWQNSGLKENFLALSQSATQNIHPNDFRS
jgi:hypothetical protein